MVAEKVLALPEIHMADQKCKGFHYPLVTKAMKSGSLCLDPSGSRIRDFSSSELSMLKRVEGRGEKTNF